ncbi:MAG: hypothetical protein KF894_08975 [Labilithrix sp.]|nr:hypothetical protein [Labilithrix sp.]
MSRDVMVGEAGFESAVETAALGGSDRSPEAATIAPEATKSAWIATNATDRAIAPEPPEGSTVANRNEPAEPVRVDPDAALRVAIRAALDAGDDARAEELFAVLRRRKPAPVFSLSEARKR